MKKYWGSRCRRASSPFKFKFNASPHCVIFAACICLGHTYTHTLVDYSLKINNGERNKKKTHRDRVGRGLNSASGGIENWNCSSLFQSPITWPCLFLSHHRSERRRSHLHLDNGSLVHYHDKTNRGEDGHVSFFFFIFHLLYTILTSIYKIIDYLMTKNSIPWPWSSDGELFFLVI
jgi:hypothetical protein